MKHRQGEKGFSLIETLVGMAILSAALIVAYSTVSNALKTVSRLAERRAAVEQVQQKVDALRREPFLRAQFIDGETDAYQWRVSVEVALGFPGKAVRPFRIVGRLMSKTVHDRSETVVDTIVIGRGA